MLPYLPPHIFGCDDFGIEFLNIFLSKYVTWGFYYSGVYTCFRPPSMHHFRIAVHTRHYLRCYVHLDETLPI